MSTPTHPPYDYLRRKIREWQAVGISSGLLISA